ncbi:MAG TPA: PadR family transcriptional regulator [Solirubrobacteraceae bacterium]|jgi:DNA-binding PadR family transcriptional regulator|nr:PadR family transcriptional regulator [Solirubrobacteraceae bacterium]
MAPPRKGDLTASVAILGLIVQRTDTVNGVGTRLIERFPHGQWSRSVAHNSLTSLEKQGLVQMVTRGAERALDRYEATDAGAEEFRDWLRASSAAPVALRDAVHAKLELAAEEDVPDLIAAIREEEEACAREFAAASSRLNVAWQLKRLGPAREQGRAAGRDQPQPPGNALGGRVRRALMTDEAMLWGMRARRLRRLRHELEDTIDEGEEPSGGDG